MDQHIITNYLKEINYKETTQDIVSMGLISSIIIKENKLAFAIKMIEDDMSYFEKLANKCKEHLQSFYPNIDISIVLTKESAPKINTTPKAKILGVKKIIAISSCKGGVGKSTITANLAAQLAKHNYKVGLADLDIYGPSVPTLFGISQLPFSNNNMMEPIEKYGVKTISFGYLVDPEKAAIWRGPMISKALHQILMQTNWGELDILLLDLPPGTGDIHLSLMSNYQIDGAVLISSPQRVALADLVKTIDMYKKLDIDIVGMIQNMSYFLDDNGKKNYIFGQDGVRDLSTKHNIKLLADIPILTKFGAGGDSGKPIVIENEEIGKYFEGIVKEIS
jgi:ATP-binding protein involved in chromosome partitioning